MDELEDLKVKDLVYQNEQDKPPVGVSKEEWEEILESDLISSIDISPYLNSNSYIYYNGNRIDSTNFNDPVSLQDFTVIKSIDYHDRKIILPEPVIIKNSTHRSSTNDTEVLVDVIEQLVDIINDKRDSDYLVIE